MLVRQAEARGSTVLDFLNSPEAGSFTLVLTNGNARFRVFQQATTEAIAASPGMTLAVQAARYALARRPDYSGGGYFGDGADLKTNYTSHTKVLLGIYFTAPEHDIYRVGSKALPEAQVEYWYIPTHKNGQLRRGKERGRYMYT